MLQNTIVQSAPILSRVVAGMWRMADWDMAPDERLSFIEQCIEQGVTTFDHADIYGNYQVEKLFGAAIARKPSIRDRMQIVTKCGIKLVSANKPAHALNHYDSSPAHILDCVDASLRNLGTDRLDVLLLHRPDPLMHVDEVAAAFSLLQKAGKVLHFGVSNFTPSQFDLLNAVFPLVTNQVEFSPLALGPLFDGTFDQCQRLKIKPMIWSALGGGRLVSDGDQVDSALQAVLKNMANGLDISVATLVYAWIMHVPCEPLVLTGSRRMTTIREAVNATSVVLTRAQWFTILEAARGHPVA